MGHLYQTLGSRAARGETVGVCAWDAAGRDPREERGPSTGAGAHPWGPWPSGRDTGKGRAPGEEDRRTSLWATGKQAGARPWGLGRQDAGAGTANARCSLSPSCLCPPAVRGAKLQAMPCARPCARALRPRPSSTAGQAHSGGLPALSCPGPARLLCGAMQACLGLPQSRPGLPMAPPPNAAAALWWICSSSAPLLVPGPAIMRVL